MAVRISIGLVIFFVMLAIAGRRFFWLGRLITSGQPAVPSRAKDIPKRLKAELVEVAGQKKLLQWTVPGTAHFFTMWGFTILILTIIEAFGCLFQRDFHIPIIGRWDAIGFLEDFFAVAVLVSLATFVVIRVKHSPKRENRRSRFFGSHTGAAWLVLLAISGVIISLLLYRAAQVNTGNFPYGWGAFASHGLAKLLHPLGTGVNSVIETTALLVNIAIIMGFLVFVAYSKHLHIFLAPINVATSRRPRALGALASTPDMTMEDVGDDDEAVFGAGRMEDFSWKQLLDLATCTECGRCQSQCPAWNTGKPLSPKLLIMDLRDNMFANADRMMQRNRAAGQEVEGLVGEGLVIDPDVLWSCTTCGACVEQCPVDIEHIDTIVDMRRYQVLMESEFPSEAGLMLRNVENQGDPWGLGSAKRTDWIESLDFEVPVITGTIPDDIEYLYWVGCAGALDERARKGAQATARHAAPCRRQLRDPRPEGVLHRRPGPPARQRVPVPGAGDEEHRDPDRRRGQEGHRHLPALLQLAGQRVPGPRRQLRGHPPQPAARPPRPGRHGSPRAAATRARSPTTTPATWAATTACSTSRAR